MSKVYTDNIEKRTGGTEMAVPATGKWPAGNIADDAVGTAQLSATGTASATTFLRGDNSWTTVDTAGLQDDIALLAFKTQANGSLARYNLVDQSVDSFEDATGVDASASTNELRNASNYYGGVAATTPSVTSNHDSTGTDGDYTWYKWTTVTAAGSYVSDTTQDYTYLVIGGGGSGASQYGGNANAAGGGGAGGMITNHGVGSAQSLTASTTYTIVVGAGGAAEPGTTGEINGNIGIDSSIAGSGLTTVTGDGGGAGNSGGQPNSQPSKSGGSGGGGGADHDAGASTQGDIGAGTGYGNAGGAGSGAPQHGGGGGGAGAGGIDGDQSDGTYGRGGLGLANSITGSAVTYAAGGGGGASANRTTGGAGGSSGIGGTGGDYKVNNATAGDVNTGSGGGAGGSAQSTMTVASGAGGTGIVILRRETSISQEGANMTLVSNAQTAQAQATKGDVVLTYTNGTGTTTLDTDLIASVSRDNGTTYTAVPLTLQGTTGGHNIATGHDVDISAQPAGTSMRWKVVTANQSNASKTTRIQAVSLGWS